MLACEKGVGCRSGNSFIVARHRVWMSYVGHEKHVPDLQPAIKLSEKVKGWSAIASAIVF